MGRGVLGLSDRVKLQGDPTNPTLRDRSRSRTTDSYYEQKAPRMQHSAGLTLAPGKNPR